MSFLYWLEESVIGVWVGQSWGYPFVLSGHAVGMSIVVGTVIMINLRLLGFSPNIPITLFRNLTRVSWMGVTLNIVSGLALFSGNPVKFFFHPVFWIKIALIVLGGLSVWWGLRSFRETGFDNEVSGSTKTIKVIATFSLLFWLGAIVAGRLIAYFKLF
ncbi:MAG: hypothetical protein ACI9SC_003247 [Gammaproteobacteria bacterium]|jgi:hypothetical protein